MDFAQRLKQLRKDRRLTQDQLAAELNVTKGTISVWERGIRKPEFNTLEKIADYFHVSVGYVLGETEDEYTFPPTDDALAEQMDAEDMEEFLNASKMYLKLRRRSRKAIDACLKAIYDSNEEAGDLVEDRFEVSIKRKNS